MESSLVEELLARRVGLDGELELRVDRRDAHVHRLRHRGEGGASVHTSHSNQIDLEKNRKYS